MSTLKDVLVKTAYRTQTTSGVSHGYGYGYGSPYYGYGYGDPYGGMTYSTNTTYMDPTLEEIRGGQQQWMGMSPAAREAYVRPDHVGPATAGGVVLGGLGGAALGYGGGALVGHPELGAMLVGTLGGVGGGVWGHGKGVASAREMARDPEVPNEYAYELARKQLLAEALKPKAPDATILPVGEPVSVSQAKPPTETKEASIASSPAISNIINRARQAGLHKIAAQMHNTPEFTLKTAVQVLGTRLAEHNARHAKIAQGLAAFDESH